MIQRFVLVLLFGLPYGLMAQALPNADSLTSLIFKTIQFIESQQVKETVPGYEFAGEWPSEMHMKSPYPLLGKHRAYDSNCFSLAATLNILADVYALDSSLKSIPKLMSNAYPQLMSYAGKNGFNFWPLLHPGGSLSWYKATNYSRWVRRPIQFPILNTYIRRAANIMNDNDDTAQALLALLRYERLLGIPLPDSLRNLSFHSFRDTLRDNRHYYNHFGFEPYNSGAFLTWRGEERFFPTNDLVLLAINNALFLTPLSTAYPKAYTPYMPYGSNDIDAVVNANILNFLAEAQRNEPGIAGATQFIHRQVRRKRYSKAGVYYPNRYHLHHAVIKACKSGSNELKPSADLLIKHLKTSQKSNGSYRSRWLVNRRDITQSTLYALHAMLLAGPVKETGLRPQIEKALHFLLTRLSVSSNAACLDGGVYFSGGTVIRNTLYWSSDAYSTALFLHCLTLIRAQTVEPNKAPKR